MLATYCFNNTRLLLLSGIGTPYDPRPARGVVGRNYSYQRAARVHVFFDDREFNPFIGGGQVNTSIDELNGDVIDRGAARLRRRRLRQHPERAARRRSRASRCRTARRAGAASGRKRWRTTTAARSAIHIHGSCMSYRAPLSRSRSDLQGRERPAAAAHDVRLARQRAEDAEVDGREDASRSRRRMKPVALSRGKPMPKKYSIVPYQSTHNVGGAVMGTRSVDQRRQQIPAVVGRSEPVRRRRQRVPAESRARPD